MRYATTPRWSLIMLIVMGLGFMAGAAGFILFVPMPTGATVGVIWLIIGAGMAFFSFRALGRAAGDDRLKRDGTPATATVVSAKTTGWVINEVPQWVLQLRIDGYGAPYDAKLKLQTYNPPSNGESMTVRVDPVNKQHIVLADDARDPAPPAPVSVVSGAGGARLSPELNDAVLAALRQAGIETSNLGPGTSSTVNADGSRTITTTTIGMDADALREADVPRDAAETVRLLTDLDRMRASGALGQTEFDAIKHRLLGEG